jgi:hypothetical protein
MKTRGANPMPENQQQANENTTIKSMKLLGYGEN